MDQTYVALLYSIVLTPQKRVRMADLRGMAESLGCKNVRTLVSSGNLVFETEKQEISCLEAHLEAAFDQVFGRHVDIIVRSAEAWRRLAGANPFPVESASAPDQVAVRVMRQPIPGDAESRLHESAGADEKIAIVNGDPWIRFSRDRPNSRLLAAVNHKRLGIGTSRNWNTVRNLALMLG